MWLNQPGRKILCHISILHKNQTELSITHFFFKIENNILRKLKDLNASKLTLGPKDESLSTHSTVNMVVNIKFKSLNTSINSSGAPWN